MLSHLYAKNAWSRRFKTKQPVYAIVEPPRERSPGGKYTQGQGIRVDEIRAVYAVRDFQSKMDSRADGLHYTSTAKFLVPFSEFDRLGIIPTQPGLMIAMAGFGLGRVTDAAGDAHAKLYKLTCDKTRDDFPTLAAGWDLAGEAPSGWVANDPAGTLVTWSPLTITNGASGHPNVVVDIQEHIHAPAVSCSFSFKVNASLAGDGPVGFFILGNSTDPGVVDGILLKIDVVSGALDIWCEGFHQALENDTWYDVTFTETSITIGDEEHEDTRLDTHGMYLVFSGSNGVVASISFRDVEVSCEHAL